MMVVIIKGVLHVFLDYFHLTVDLKIGFYFCLTDSVGINGGENSRSRVQHDVAGVKPNLYVCQARAHVKMH